MIAELVVAFVMIAADWRFLERPVDAFDPAIGPWMAATPDL